MDFEPRLSILRQAGMLSDEDYQKVQDVIRYFQEKYDLTLTEENASSMITHLCAALGRIQRGEPVEPLDEEVYEETKGELLSPRLWKQRRKLSGTPCPVCRRTSRSSLRCTLGFCWHRCDSI